MINLQSNVDIIMCTVINDNVSQCIFLLDRIVLRNGQLNTLRMYLNTSIIIWVFK